MAVHLRFFMVTHLNQRRDMDELIKQHVSRSKLSMKKQAGKHRFERVFKVGDYDFLNLQPYIQASLAPRLNQKLAFKFFGPFHIIESMGSTAYKLELPPST